MTYLQFLLLFLVPPILVMLALPGRPLASRSDFLALGLVGLIAFVYTTPWDNYLVWRGVWGYGTERVIGVVGWVPIEEYLFFLLQPVLTGLFLFRVAEPAPATPPTASRAAVAAGVLFWLAVAVAGVVLLRWDRGTYLGLILAWAGPVLAGQWALGAGRILARPRTWLLATLAPTVYLWVADRIAIGLEIWTIALEFSTGFLPFGLPVEEAVFFLITNLLVVQGLFLLAPLEAAKRGAAPVRTGVSTAKR